jgi:two-component flavin-dependent monooxygenase
MGNLDVDHLIKLATDQAEEADRTGRLTGDVAAAITASGLLRHFVPTVWGGSQGTLAACVEPLSRLSAADPSAGWCASIMASASRMAACLPPEGQRAIWGDGPDVAIAATLQPAGTATPQGDGWSLTGRWPFVSGAEHCRWALLSTTAEGVPRFMLVPHDAWTIEPTWDNLGLRATASHTLHVENTHVPAAHTCTRRDLFDGLAVHGNGNGAGPGAGAQAIPHEAVSGLFFAMPLLGAAVRFLDTYLSTRVRVEPSAHTVVGFAAGQIHAAQLLLHHAAASADAGPHHDDLTTRLRLDYATAGRLATAATNQLFSDAGVRATSRTHPLQRLWRDVNTAAQHPALNLTQPSGDFVSHHTPATL